MTFVPKLAAAPEAADDHPDVRELASTALVRVLDYRCQPHSRQATSHQHDAFTISLVQQGAFCCQSRGGTYLLEPGALLLGQPGEEYACSHEYGGDRCLVLQFHPDALAGLTEAAKSERPAAMRSAQLDVLASRIQNGLVARSPTSPMMPALAICPISTIPSAGTSAARPRPCAADAQDSPSRRRRSARYWRQQR